MAFGTHSRLLCEGRAIDSPGAGGLECRASGSRKSKRPNEIQGLPGPWPPFMDLSMSLTLPCLLLSLLPTWTPQDGNDPQAGGQGEGQTQAVVDAGDHYILNFAQPGATTGDEGYTYLKFVELCQQLTGINFTYSDETAAMLGNTKVRLLGPKRVPKEEFYSFFQILMIINSYVCTNIGPDHLSVVQISSLKTQERANVKNDALQVAPTDLDRYADQPATLITTVVHLPNTDVRQLSNSMRTMFPDVNTTQLLPAGNTNSMIVTGFGSNVSALVRMLQLIDEASKIEAVLPEFALIPVEFVPAADIHPLIEELLDASVRAAQQRGQRVEAVQGATGAATRGRTEAKLMVDERTNSLLVMAMPEDMPRIKQLIAELDVDTVARERNYHIYNLQNVGAEDLADTLNEFLEDTARMEAEQGAPGSGQAGGRSGTPTSRRTSEFVVVPDKETNSLLIAAGESRYTELSNLIKRLDTRQNQVLIETALIELSGRDFLDIGVELGFADLPGMDETGGFGVTSFGLSTLADTDGDGVPDIKVPNAANGVTAGILDGDNFSLPVLLSLVQERRKANVLNVPSVLVNNNGTAKVSSKEFQPTTNITAFGGGVGGGQTQESFNEYVDAGITMEISPSISARNFLRLTVYLQISTFLGAVSGPIPPGKTERTIETTVNVPDGDTMVIGGIIIDNTQQTTNQVPLLGDIPLLGYLFKRRSDSQDRTALYFFVTPHIMSDLEFADLYEISYKKKQEAADAIGAGRIRQIDPTFGKEDTPYGLEGFDVPIYSSPERGEVDPADVGLNDPQRQNQVLEAARQGREE